jgi:hypothetical protein
MRAEKGQEQSDIRIGETLNPAQIRANAEDSKLFKKVKLIRELIHQRLRDWCSIN